MPNHVPALAPFGVKLSALSPENEGELEAKLQGSWCGRAGAGRGRGQCWASAPSFKDAKPWEKHPVTLTGAGSGPHCHPGQP